MSPTEKFPVPVLRKRKVVSTESYDRFVSKRGVPEIPTVQVQPHVRTVETRQEGGEVRRKPRHHIFGRKEKPKTDLEAQANEIDEFVESETDAQKEIRKEKK